MQIKFFLPFAILGVALAQGPRGPGADPSRFTELKAYLNLTDSQIQQMRDARQQAMTSARSVVTQMRDKEKALRDLLDSGTTDAAAVGRIVLDIQTLRKQVQQTRESVRQTVLGFLTAEQKTKLTALQQAAELRAPIQQAMILGLLDPPEPGFGIGGGARRGPGPEGAFGARRGPRGARN